MNKWKGCEWTKKCALAFKKLKEYLSWPPIMSSPDMDEILFAYIAVSLVLIQVDSGIQRLIYYASKSLHEAEVCYLLLEKVILAIVHATCKLPHYFQAHTIVVLTQFPLKALLRSANYTERIAKLVTILGAFDIKYIPRTFVKGQVLEDFVAEFAESSFKKEVEAQHMDEKSVSTVILQEPLFWKVYVDGIVNQRGPRVGLVLVLPEKITIKIEILGHK